MLETIKSPYSRYLELLATGLTSGWGNLYKASSRDSAYGCKPHEPPSTRGTVKISAQDVGPPRGV